MSSGSIPAPAAPSGLDSIAIVLVDTQHPGNLGSVARAMKTMGLSDLRLVRPQRFPHAEASAMASNAADVLDAARVFADLPAALADRRWVLGCTARARDFGIPEWGAREAATETLQRGPDGGVALVFGPERTGLDNDDLGLCHAALRIPANPVYSSLNLAMAVQVVAYELWMAAQSQTAPMPRSNDGEAAATHQELEGLFGHLARWMELVDFHQGRPPEHALQRLRRIFLRGGLDAREVRMLRGLLTETERRLQGPR